MRALVCRKLGGPDGLALVDDWPEPAAGPGAVVVAVAAAALNFPDLLTLQGTYQHRQEPPFVSGLEAAGIVVAAGVGVDAALVGRRVMFSARGALAARVAVPISELLDVPAGWNLDEAAAFPIGAKTAYHALVQRAHLAAGETLLVNGASGGMGHLAVKLGKALGARVIATGTDSRKLDIVRGLGADAVIPIAEDSAATAGSIKAANGGAGVDVVFDPVGGAAFDAALKATAFGARVAIVGFTSGGPNVVRTNYCLIKSLSLLGIRAGEAARFDPRLQAGYLNELPALAAGADLRPRVAARYPFADARAAFDRLAGRDFVGKIVVDGPEPAG